MNLKNLSKGVTKMFGKNNAKFLNIFILLGVVVLIGVLLKYNGQKMTLNDGMRNPLSGTTPVGAPVSSDVAAPVDSVAKPIATTDPEQQFLAVSGLDSGKKPTNTCNNQPVMNPKELLPTDSNNEWSNIMPNNDLKNVGMLNAGHHVGINTVGSSLRNANLQVRSEPVIPQTNVGPWHNTTIEADNMRKNLEIGSVE